MAVVMFSALLIVVLDYLWMDPDSKGVPPIFFSLSWLWQSEGPKWNSRAVLPFLLGAVRQLWAVNLNQAVGGTGTEFKWVSICTTMVIWATISPSHTEGEIMVGTWLGECCRQVEAEEVSNSRNKIHQTTYQPLFPPLYVEMTLWHC